MATSTDPFTQTLDKLWEIVEGHSALTSRIKMGNRLKWTTHQHRRRRVQDLDVPLLEIVPEQYSLMNLKAAKSGKGGGTALLVKTWEFRLATGRLEIDAELFPIEWELLRAFARYENENGPTLGLSFVTNTEFSTGTDAIEDLEQNRGRQGWSTIIGLDVYYDFDLATQLLADTPSL